MITIIKKGSPIEEIQKKLEKAISKQRSKVIMKYAGKLKHNIDPLKYQKQMRNEWE